MAHMTSRERVMATLLRKPSDRLPVGEMGFDVPVGVAVRKLLRAPADADLAVLLGVDLASISPRYDGPGFPWKPEKSRGSFFGSSDKTYSDGAVARPLRDASSLRDVETFAWPSAEDYDYSTIADQCLGAGEHAVMTNCWTPTFSQMCELFGMETALTHIAGNPAMMRAGAEKIADLVIALLQRVHAAAGGRLDIFGTADDLATQRGLMFSPRTWREVFKPSLARQLAAAKKLGLATWMHSCGDIHAILPDLVEIGLDVIEPTQAHLPGMRPEWLKREFGRDLTFFGGISTQTTLPFGTPDDVRREVRERVRVLGEDGGYIVAPDHTLMEGVPAANVLALYSEAGSLRA